MKTILHHQNTSYKVNDIFVIDGIVSEYGSDPKQEEAIQILNKNAFRLKKRYYSQPHPNSLTMYIGVNDMLIKSKSKTKDEMGRYISYEFYIASYKDISDTISLLKENVTKSGLEINDSDIPCIEQTLKMVAIEKIISIGILCTIFISLIVNLIK